MKPVNASFAQFKKNINFFRSLTAFSRFAYQNNKLTMGPQSTDGWILLVTLASICAVILITAFSLTFFAKRDTRDKAAH